MRYYPPTRYYNPRYRIRSRYDHTTDFPPRIPQELVMPDLVSESSDDEQTLSEDEKEPDPSAAIMYFYIRELIFLFALIVTSYTALFSSVSKVSKPPVPAPFFPPDSVVVDCYKGNVNTAFQKSNEAELTVVMYYASWDADSQAARNEFLSTAELLHREVYFTAISCWSPTSECKRHLPHIRHFPIIVAYPRFSKGIHYQGPIKSVFLIHFIKTIMRPLKRIHTFDDIIDLSSKHNVIVVGGFLFNGIMGSPGYHVYYSASMRILEKDPYREIMFAITTDRKAAIALGFDSLPSLRLYLWNETHDYPVEAAYSEDAVVQWVWQKMHEVVKWVSPPKIKSRLLRPYLTQGPVLILFTPRNPLFGVNPMYNLLREISYRYYNCDNNPWLSNIITNIEKKNQELSPAKSKHRRHCMIKAREKEIRDNAFWASTSAVPAARLNTTQCPKEDNICDLGELHTYYLHLQMNVCFYDAKYENFYKGKYKPDISCDYEYLDKRSSAWLMAFWDEHQCKCLRRADDYYKLQYPKPADPDFKDTVDGLACANNRTLTIIAMDSLSYYQFAEGLGINILRLEDKTAVAIVDAKAESQYFLKVPVNKETLTSFIVEHTKGSLSRSLRSTHDAMARTISRYRFPVRSDKECFHSDTSACVPELHSNNFLDFVLNQSRAALVFYHTPFCAMCRSISHLFLLLSRYFRFFPGIKFGRIDGDNNDLPWEYTMDVYPTLLFFPTIDKSESRLYSTDLPFTIRNLVNFVLGNLEPEAKIPGMVSLCLNFEKLQKEKEARRCKAKIQKESYEGLSKTLKETRKIMNRWKNLPPVSRFTREIHRRKKILLLKLEYYKTIHFLLGSVDKLQLKSNVPTDIMKLYQKLLSLMKCGTDYLYISGF